MLGHVRLEAQAPPDLVLFVPAGWYFDALISSGVRFLIASIN